MRRLLSAERESQGEVWHAFTSLPAPPCHRFGVETRHVDTASPDSSAGMTPLSELPAPETARS